MRQSVRNTKSATMLPIIQRVLWLVSPAGAGSAVGAGGRGVGARGRRHGRHHGLRELALRQERRALGSLRVRERLRARLRRGGLDGGVERRLPVLLVGGRRDGRWRRVHGAHRGHGRLEDRRRGHRPHRLGRRLILRREELDAHAGSARAELDLVTVRQLVALDRPTRDQRAVAAAHIAQHPHAALAPDLGVAPRRIEIRMRIERDVRARQPAERDDVLVELTRAASVRAEGLVESDLQAGPRR